MPNSNFMGALAGGIGHDAIDSDGRENQGEQAERAREGSGDALKGRFPSSCSDRAWSG